MNESGDSFLWDRSHPDPDRWAVIFSGRAGRLTFDMGTAASPPAVVTDRIVLNTSRFPTNPSQYLNWREEDEKLQKCTF